MPPTTFEKLLADLINRARSPDDPIRQEFHDGDIEHLERWLDYPPGANKIWDKIAEGPFNSGDAFVFIITALQFRRGAEETDSINKEFPALQKTVKSLARRASKRALRLLADSKI